MAQKRTKTSKPVVLISRCLLGVPCRYHGRRYTRWGKRIGRPQLIARLRKRYTLIDICPEVDAGLPTPRPPTRKENGRYIAAGADVTAVFLAGAKLALRLAQRHHVERAYLLRGSPSCDSIDGATGCLLRQHRIRVCPV